MSVTILQGHVLDVLPAIAAGSVHCCVTSIPYFGLRQYNTQPQVWDGDPACPHRWDEVGTVSRRGAVAGPTAQVGNTVDRVCPPVIAQGAHCLDCGAWLGEYGSEPTPAAFVRHTVIIMRAVRRLLHVTGTLWLNVGDSHAGDRSYQVPDSKHKDVGNNAGSRVPDGYQPGDLLGIPGRIAEALQEDGWHRRSDITWLKRSPMPESVSGVIWTRHRIRRAEYERLYGVPAGTTSGGVSASQSSVQGVRGGTRTGSTPSRSAPGSQTALPAEREGQGNGPATRGTAGRAGETAPVRGVSAGAGEPSQVRLDGERQGDSSQGVRPLPANREGAPEGAGERPAALENGASAGTAEGVLRPVSADREGASGAGAAQPPAAPGPGNVGAPADLDAVARDPERAQAPVLLLQGANVAVDDGSRHPAEQGRGAHQDERRSGVSELQQQEARQALAALLRADDWVDCPGCPKCEKHDGLVLRWGHGRPTRATEMIYLFGNTERHFYDLEATRIPLSAMSQEMVAAGERWGRHRKGKSAPERADGDSFKGAGVSTAQGLNPGGRNIWNWWEFSYDPNDAWFLTPEQQSDEFCGACLTLFDAKSKRRIKRVTQEDGTEQRVCPVCGETERWVGHYAAFPSELPRRAIKAGTSERGACSACGEPWARVVERGEVVATSERGGYGYAPSKRDGSGMVKMSNQAGDGIMPGRAYQSTTLGWLPTCSCLDAAGQPFAPIPCTVLDPFSGSGTTPREADRLGRTAIAGELNGDYVAFQKARLERDAGLFAQVAVTEVVPTAPSMHRQLSLLAEEGAAAG
jgi:DNA modification methylase